MTSIPTSSAHSIKLAAAVPCSLISFAHWHNCSRSGFSLIDNCPQLFVSCIAHSASGLGDFLRIPAICSLSSSASPSRGEISSGAESYVKELINIGSGSSTVHYFSGGGKSSPIFFDEPFIRQCQSPNVFRKQMPVLFGNCSTVQFFPAK